MLELSPAVQRAARLWKERNAIPRTASPNVRIDVKRGGVWVESTLGEEWARADMRRYSGRVLDQMLQSGLLRADGTLDGEVAATLGHEFVIFDDR